jgi:hypothetical protein
VPLTELDKDLKRVETTPDHSYISPNVCNPGVAGQCPAGAPQAPAAADAFLAQIAPRILDLFQLDHLAGAAPRKVR